MSRGGLFIQTTVVARPGANVALDLSGPSGESLEVDARVVWKRIVPADLMSVGNGGVGLRIKHASENYYQFLQEIAERSQRPPAKLAVLNRYHVRLKLSGKPRSRSLTVFAESEDDARRQALTTADDGWSVIELKERSQS